LKSQIDYLAATLEGTPTPDPLRQPKAYAAYTALKDTLHTYGRMLQVDAEGRPRRLVEAVEEAVAKFSPT